MITPHGLAVVAVTVAASLAVLFPGSTSATPGSSPTPTSCRSPTWIRCCASGPTIASARLLLARQQRALGKWSDAEANLRLLVERQTTRSPGGRASRWSSWSARGRRAAAVGRGAAARGRRPRCASCDGLRPRRLRLRARRGDLAGGDLAGSPRSRWLWNHRATPRRFTNASASQEPARRREWALLAGRWYRAAGHLPESATAYLAASAAAGPHDDGAADLLAAIDVLRATDDGARALQVIEQAIGRWPADWRLLARAVDLALAAERRPSRPELRGASGRARARRRSGPVAAAPFRLAVGDNEAALRTLSALVERPSGR